MSGKKLTGKQVEAFRRLPGTFADMVQAVYDAGRIEGMTEAANIAEEMKLYEGAVQESYKYCNPWEIAAAIRQRMEG